MGHKYGRHDVMWKHTIEGVRLIEVFKNFQCLLTLNIQRLLCTLIKFHAVKEAKEAVLYFVQDF